jgi:hypothetical protein
MVLSMLRTSARCGTTYTLTAIARNCASTCRFRTGVDAQLDAKFRHYNAHMNNTHRRLHIDLSAWQHVVSGNAQLKLTPLPSGRTTALKLDYDFHGGGGFVVARCALSGAMPEDYAVNFRLRGTGAVNSLELKLIDATGQNVWRHVQKDLVPPQRWKNFKIPSQEIDFAWGPMGSGRMATLGSIEFAIVAGAGGQGTLWISDLEIEDCTPTAPPQVAASSASADGEAPCLLSGAGWRPRLDDARPWVIIDWSEPRTIGGLVIDWLEQAPARGLRPAAAAPTSICPHCAPGFCAWT